MLFPRSTSTARCMAAKINAGIEFEFVSGGVSC